MYQTTEIDLADLDSEEDILKDSLENEDTFKKPMRRSRGPIPVPPRRILERQSWTFMCFKCPEILLMRFFVNVVLKIW